MTVQSPSRDPRGAALPAPAASGPASWARPVALAALVSTVLVVMLTAFAWPAARSGLHDVPLAVAGPGPAVSQVTTMLERQRPGAFDVRVVADEAAAAAAISDREVYGAIVLGGPAPVVLTASAASPAVSQGLTQLAAALSAEASARSASGGSASAGSASGGSASGAATVAVRDVVPAPADDPRGAGLAAGAFPLALGGVLTAALLTLRLRGYARRLVAVAIVWAVGGTAMTVVLHAWLGVLTGAFWAEAGAVALTLAATSLTLLGLEWLFGLPGLGAGAAVVVFLGNPLSGLASAPEMLPSGWGTFGQLLPPGAGGSLLRSVAFFDGAAAGRPLAVLLGWLAAGAVLATLAAVRRPAVR